MDYFYELLLENLQKKYMDNLREKSMEGFLEEFLKEHQEKKF